MTVPSVADRILAARWSTVAGVVAVGLLFAAAVWLGIAMPQPLPADVAPATTAPAVTAPWPPTSPYVKPTPVTGPHGEVVRALPTTTTAPEAPGAFCRQLLALCRG